MNLDEQAVAVIADRIADRLRVQPADQMIFGQLYALFYEKRVLPFLRRPKNVYWFYKNHGSQWADVPVNKLNIRDLQQWVNDMGENSGHATANRAIATMSSILSWGVRTEHIHLEKNPCRGVTRFEKVTRERFLTPGELSRLSDSLDKEKFLWRDFVLMCLLTGARCGNIQSMRWDELDFDLGIWHIPATKHKNGESLNIALTEAALSILMRRKSVSEGSGWVFPSYSQSRSGHLEDARKAWKRITKAAGLSKARLHDLRRTRASYMAMDGISDNIIAKALGHKDIRSTRVYARLDLSSVREASENIDELWRPLLSLPTPEKKKLSLVQKDESEPYLPAPESQHVPPMRKVSEREQIFIEAKILTVLKRGGNKKNQMYSKIGGHLRLRFDAFEMERILNEMIARNLIFRYRDEEATNQNPWRYGLCDERHSKSPS